jgi:hypothetical protein
MVSRTTPIGMRRSSATSNDASAVVVLMRRLLSVRRPRPDDR